MPRIYRRPKQRRAGYTATNLGQLLRGCIFVGDELGADALRRAWADLRGELLPAWIAEHSGTRPAAWWQFDSPERRRRIDGKPHPFTVPARNAWIEKYRSPADDPTDHRRGAYRLTFGKPSILIPYDPPTFDDFDSEYELEANYLARLQLLGDDERAALVVECAAE